MTKILKYRGYTGTIDIDIDENCLHGVIEFIVDIVSYSASTPDELQVAFNEAVDDYIETCEKLGREPQKPFSGTFNVRVSADLHKRAAIQSKALQISLNEVIKVSLTEYLDNLNEQVVHHIHKIESSDSEKLVFSSEEEIESSMSGVENWTQNKVAFQKHH